MYRLWNLIRVSKNKQNNFSENDIGIETLFKHYKNTFLNDSCHDNTYVKDEAEVQEKYNNLMSSYIHMPKLHVNMLTKYIKSLQLGRSPGVDGLTSEHLTVRYSVNTNVTNWGL